MTNKKCRIGKKARAARRIAGILMTGTLAGTIALGTPGVVQVSAATWQENADYVFEYLTQKLGYSEAAACGIMANIRCESTFNPHAWNAGGGSYGLCQWTGGRYTRLRNWCSSNGYDYTTIDGQLSYLEYELENHYRGVEEHLRSVENTADGAYSAGQYYCYHFEAPASRGSVSVYRGGLASGTFWDSYRPAEWYQVDGIWHYILRDGSYQTSWLNIEDQTFYLDENGNRVSGWRNIDGSRYYFDKDGVMVTGWLKVDGKDYYFDKDGSLVTGIVLKDDDWYMFDETGNIHLSSRMKDFAETWIAASDSARDTALASSEEDSATEDTEKDAVKTASAADQDVDGGSAPAPAETESAETVTLASAETETTETITLFTLPSAETESAVDVTEERDSGTALNLPSIASVGKAGLDSHTEQNDVFTDILRNNIAKTQSTSASGENEETVAEADTEASSETAVSEKNNDTTETTDIIDTTETTDTAETNAGEEAGETSETGITGETAETDGSEAAEAEVKQETVKTAKADEEENTDKGDSLISSDEFAAAEALRAAAAALNEESNEDGFTNGFFLIHEPEKVGKPASAAETGTGPEIIPRAVAAQEQKDDTADNETAGQSVKESVKEKDTEDSSEKADTSDTEEKAVVSDTSDTADVSDTANTSDTSDTADISVTADTSDTANASDTVDDSDEKDSDIEKPAVEITLTDDIPEIPLDDIHDLVKILDEKDILHAVTRDGVDITDKVETSFEMIGKDYSAYKVIFSVEYKGETTEIESVVHIKK